MQVSCRKDSEKQQMMLFPGHWTRSHSLLRFYHTTNIKNTSSVQPESHQPAESHNDEHKENNADFPTLKLSLR